MLRYFYLIICIQMCICSIYVDNNVDYDTVSRPARSRTTKGMKKLTKSLRSRVVQFDVQNFLQGPVEVADDYRLYGYRDKKRNNRYSSSNDVGYAETHGSSNEQNKQADYSFKDHTGTARVNTRSQHKMVNPKHFNWHSLDTRSGDQKKAAGHEHSKAKDERTFANSERKCSFRNMRIPFFSRNKATAKAKRHKKRRIFCFNCKKTTTAAVRKTTTNSKVNENTGPKLDDSTKDNQNPPNFDKTNEGIKISKRAYGQLCPKCIRELLVNLKKKTSTTTKKVKHSTQKAKQTNKRATKQKTNLEDTLEDGFMDMGNERMKRNEEEERERERRLKELEEVEKKIANVHITTPYLNRGNLSSK